ncbi:L,D-transpeptidase family protein [Thaumasiovibrio subtropicus]|uniref:L,D-transpeptidase family protein n=1 Tax=Thaumasiovibrio subtropicus TaxID=1891207 RepID=UPI000B35ECFE|nr:L,D-transpeptidase family protein [Thaumasiovibrio subtropicus]
MRVTYRALSHCLWLWMAFASLSVSAMKLETNSGSNPVTQAWVAAHLPEGAELQYPDLVEAIYTHTRLHPIWEDERVRLSLEQQINVIALADISPWFEDRAKLLSQLQQAQRWRHFDVMATDTLLTFLRYRQDVALQGKGWLFGAGVQQIKLPPNAIEIESMMEAWKGNYFLSWIEGKKPFGDAYAQMLDGILTLQALEARDLPVFEYSGVLRPGDMIPNPEPLIVLLETMGDLSPELATLLRGQPGGIEYNPILVEAVKRFQGRHGLAQDGAVGPKTRIWLNKPASEKVRLMALNMERLRLWSPQRNNQLVVNIPGYSLTWWSNDEVQFESRVIVGRPSRRTPLLSSHLNTVVFNPSWNVPESITQKDIIPKIKRDTNYLANNNMEILASWRSSEVIAVESIDWETMNPERFPYRLRQSPGNHNALGRYKFNMPSTDAIYLHDTPAKGLFHRSERALSSGCIRVEQSHNLATILMDRAGVRPDKVADYRKSVETKFVSVRRTVPVETIYQTAWVDDETGTLQFRPDIYKYDQRQRWPFDQEVLAALGI